jgi:hypothetical protein
MVRFQRVAQGTGVQALQWAQEVAKYLNDKYPSNPVQVYTERYGDLSKIYWIADYDDIATLDARGTAILADEGYVALLAKAQQGNFFLPGSAHDTVLVPA